MNRLLLIILIYGAIGALVVGAFMVSGSLTWAQAGTEPPENGVVVGYLTQLVGLTVVFLGVKHYRDVALGGVIKFLPAFGVGLAISAIASLGWVISWEIVLAISGFDYPAMAKEMMLKDAVARGLTGAALEKVVAEADAFAKLYNMAPARWSISFVEIFVPLGILVPLISALILRNSRFLPARQTAV